MHKDMKFFVWYIVLNIFLVTLAEPTLNKQYYYMRVLRYPE